MLEAKDFRIGNCINAIGQDRIIKGISQYNQIQKTQTVSHYFEFDGLLPINQIHIKPIPITDDWLINRFEFKKVKCNEFWDFYQLENGYYIGLAKHNEPSAGVKKGFYYAGNNYFQLDYIHDLQNHYFYNHFKKELKINK